MHFVLQKDTILIRTFRGFYICPKIDALLNVIAKGGSHPAIIHNYQSKAMLDFKSLKTWGSIFRIEVNPATITGYIPNDWVYTDANSDIWVRDPNYEKYTIFKTCNQPIRKDVKNLHRILDSL